MTEKIKNKSTEKKCSLEKNKQMFFSLKTY